MTHTNLAMWPEGIDLAGTPRGNLFNVNIEYMVTDPKYLCTVSVHDYEIAIDAVFNSQGNRPTRAFTPDFVLSARGAVLITGDGKSAAMDIYEGEQTICLVACHQFAYQPSCLGLTSSNFRLCLVELEKETFDFAPLPPTLANLAANPQTKDEEDITDPAKVNLPSVKVTTYLSERFEVRAKKQDPHTIHHSMEKPTLNNPDLTHSGRECYQQLCDMLKEFCTGVFETMDRLIFILQPCLTLANLGLIQ